MTNPLHGTTLTPEQALGKTTKEIRAALDKPWAAKKTSEQVVKAAGRRFPHAFSLSAAELTDIQHNALLEAQHGKKSPLTKAEIKRALDGATQTIRRALGMEKVMGVPITPRKPALTALKELTERGGTMVVEGLGKRLPKEVFRQGLSNVGRLASALGGAVGGAAGHLAYEVAFPNYLAPTEDVMQRAATAARAFHSMHPSQQYLFTELDAMDVDPMTLLDAQIGGQLPDEVAGLLSEMGVEKGDDPAKLLTPQDIMNYQSFRDFMDDENAEAALEAMRSGAYPEQVQMLPPKEK